MPVNHSLFVRLCWAMVCTLALASLGSPARAQNDAPAVVRVVEVQRGGLGEVLTLTGTLTPQRSAGLSPRVDGLLARVAVDAGDHLERGQLLLELDATVAELALQGAQAERERADALRSEAARRVAEAEPLVQQRSLPETELAARRAALAEATAVQVSAEVAERELQEQLQRHRLLAPFDGVITERSTEAGEWVSRTDAVLQLVDLDAIRLDVQAPQERFAELRSDTRVFIEPDMQPGSAIAARIQARVPVTSSTRARTFLVRVIAELDGNELLPGTSARARFELGDSGAAVRISRDALLRHPDGGFSVFVAAAGDGGPRAERRTVELGREAGGEVEVLRGLQPGDAVVVRGNEVLREGQPLRVETAAQEG
jgi:RND family efflux transporter MFP subunit